MSVRGLVKQLPYPIKQGLKYAYGSLPPRIRYGKVFWETYNFLQESQWWSKERLEEYQMQQLEKLLKHAYENVPYYRRVFNERGLKPKDIQDVEDLKKLPHLTKDKFRYNFNNKNEVGDPKGEISYPNQRKVEWWKSPRNFHRNLLPGDLKNLVASRGTIKILEYDLDVQKFSESLQKIAETVAGKELIAEVTGEDEIHEYLVNHLGELEEGLTFKESEYGISVGSIDILAEDRNGLPVIIEVKVRADDSTIGQLLGYIQAYEEESGIKARGFIVAESFTERCKKAAKRASIELYECRKMFKFRRMK